MYRKIFITLVRNACRNLNMQRAMFTSRYRIPVSVGIATAFCETSSQTKLKYNEDTLGHEFLIRQATTVNVNAATQLLTVTLVAVQDTSQKLRETLSQEICLVRQAMEWGESGTPPHHWDQLVAVRGTLADLRHNLRNLLSYMEYAEKIATVAAEISFLSGNMVASDAICERIEHACRTCKTEHKLNNELQLESNQLQQKAIETTPAIEDLITANRTDIGS